MSRYRLLPSIALLVLIVGLRLPAAGSQEVTGAGERAKEPAAKPHSEARPGFAVVELFTSEGCSSCPPADEVLGQIVTQAEDSGETTYALAWHVDYWDYLGWKDPYATAAATERQQRYAEALGSRLYTPQAIVNGRHIASYAGSEGAVGGLVDSVIEAAEAQPSQVSVTVGPAIPRGRTLHISYHVEGLPDCGEVLIAAVEGNLSQHVTAGENRGRTLSHRNVVRSFALLSEPEGTARLELPADFFPENGAVVALVQNRETMEIVDATGRPFAIEPSTVIGRVAQQDGEAAAGVRVLICSDYICVPGSTEVDGSFVISDIPAGSYRVVLGTLDGNEVARISIGSGETLELPEALIAKQDS